MPRTRSWRSLSLVVGAMVLFALAASAFSMKTAESAPPSPASSATSLIVKFNVDANENAIAALNAAHGTEQVDAIPAVGLRVLRLPSGAAAETVAEAYARNPLVEFAEPNELVAPEAIPNDPKFGNQWQLTKIQVQAAWDSAKATGLLATVCDTGVLATHPDLAAVLRGDLGWNAADGSSDWSPVIGHGTAVAGTIAAASNNGIGVAGVAWGAQIIPVRISNLSNGSAYVSDAVKCINYGADHGSRVINLSYRMADSPSIDTAGRYAQSKGALTFVAAGNDGIEYAWPNYTGFIAVAATDQQDAKASFSNFGPYIDLAAPGNGVYTTAVLTNAVTGEVVMYGSVSGTSFSSPVAAGVAALLFGAKPSLSAAQAQSILFSSADDLGTAGWDKNYGNGRVNAANAVAAALGGSAPPPSDTTPPTVAIATPTSGATVSGTVSASANASDNVGVAKVEFYLDDVLKSTVTASPWAWSWTTTTVSDATYSLSAKAYDAAGNAAASSPVPVAVSNTVADATPPEVSITSPGPGAALSGTIGATASASDNLSVAKVEFYLDGVLKATKTAAPYNWSWDTTTATNATHSLAAKAYDSAGNGATSAAINVTVQNTAAAPLPVTQSFSGSLGGKNKPLTASHSVTVTTSGLVTGSLTWSGKANLDVSVYDSSGQLVASGLQAGSKSESLSFAASAGTYTFLVKAASGSAAYALKVTHP